MTEPVSGGLHPGAFAFPLPDSSGTALGRRAAATVRAAARHFGRIGVARMLGADGSVEIDLGAHIEDVFSAFEREPDRSLVADRAFFEKVLAEGPLHP